MLHQLFSDDNNGEKKKKNSALLHVNNGDFPLLQGNRYGDTYITNYIPRRTSKLNHSICLWLNTFEFLSGFT